MVEKNAGIRHGRRCGADGATLWGYKTHLAALYTGTG